MYGSRPTVYRDSLYRPRVGFGRSKPFDGNISVRGLREISASSVLTKIILDSMDSPREIRWHFTRSGATLASGRPNPLRFVSTLSPAFANPVLTRWFTQEVLPHETALRNWLRHRFPRLHDWDDLIQESYLRLWRARAEGPIQSPKAYLFTTARNLALNRLGQIHQKEGLGEHDFSPVLMDEVSTPERVARHQELELLNQALQSLPERCREVFTLRRLYGLSQKEIAAKLGISEKTVEGQSLIAMKKCMLFFQQLDRSASTLAPARSHHG